MFALGFSMMTGGRYAPLLQICCIALPYQALIEFSDGKIKNARIHP